MRAVVVCLGFWFLAISPGLGQIVLNSQQRRVEAGASVRFGLPPMQEQDSEEAMSLETGAFTETVTAIVPNPLTRPPDPQATAWQDSFISPTSFIARGGVRDLLNPAPAQLDTFTSGASSVDVEFSVVDATVIQLSGDLLWAPTGSTCGGGYYLHGGAVRYSLMGPVTVSRMPVNYNPPCELEPRHHLFTDVLVLEPGSYTLSILSQHEVDVSSIDSVVTPVAYDVRMDVVPIPEPSTWALALVVITWATYRSVYRWHHFCHLGK